VWAELPSVQIVATWLLHRRRRSRDRGRCCRRNVPPVERTIGTKIAFGPCVALSHRLRTALLSVGQSELVAGCPCVLLSACAVSAGDVSGPPSAVQDHPGRAIPAPWPVLGVAGRCQPETLDPASGPWQRREMDAVSTAGGIEARSGVDIARAR
jgi:hypothetical protein